MRHVEPLGEKRIFEGNISDKKILQKSTIHG